VTNWLARDGAYMVFALMALDALLPASGELTMLLAGAIAGGAIAGAHATVFGATLTPGLEGYVVLSLAGVLGSVAGGLLGWWIGARGGRPLIERHGRRLHVGPEAFARAERWFARFGGAAVFLGRLTPVVRSFIAIPAGVLGTRLASYTLLTLASAVVWCFGLAGAGWALGAAWTSVDHAFRFAELAVVAVMLALLGVAGARRARRISQAR
jgi:membrane protein DedA with SNARE-associated domain